jgi:hypothetical protein
MVQNAKREALLAVDLYNRPTSMRSVEGYVVHMMIAWINLLHAVFERRGVDYRYRQQNGWFVRTEDGDPKTWDLRRSAREYFPNQADPMRRNLEFFIGLSNKIEHHYASGLGQAIAGKSQALLLNFEAILIREFGGQEALGDELRFPVFISQLTADAVDSLRRLYAQLPRRVRTYIEDFDASVADPVREDSAYEFRVYMVEKLARTAGHADLAVEFVRRDSLTAEQLAVLDEAVVMIRDRRIEVANLDKLKPHEVVARVKQQVPWFNRTHHIRAWKFHRVRPADGAEDPTQTDVRYCVYDRPHKDYLYTEAWVRKLSKDLSEASEKFPEIAGRIVPLASPAAA